jgi:high-affinity Fe2+/Pb2+ permease
VSFRRVSTQNATGHTYLRLKGMSENKPTPRSTKIVAGGVVGALMAAVIGQRVSAWTLESQTNTILIAAAGLIVGVVVMLFVTARTPARAPTM